MFVANADGSDARQLWRVPHHNFTWSPDGSGLLIGVSSAVLVDAKTGTATRLVPKEAIEAQFAPDGKNILYRTREVVAGGTRSYDLYIGDADGKHARRLKDGVTMFSVSPLLEGKPQSSER